MKMKFLPVLIIAFLSFCNIVFAEHGWKRVNYTNSTTFTGIVTVNDNPVEDGDFIGIFVYDSSTLKLECRMISEIFTLDGKSVVSSVIHGVKKERVVVKYWNSVENKVYNIDTVFETLPGGDMRNVPLKLKASEDITDMPISKDKGLMIYPSPAISKVTIDASKDILGVNLINNLGLTVKSVLNEKSSSVMDLTIEELPQGLYLLNIQYNDGTTETKKIYKK